MDAALKAKWVEALRSGEYQQGKSQFEYHGRFCCLGVLCDVAAKPTTIGTSGNWPFADESVGDPKISNLLAGMNDDGKPFPEIADYIEANL